MDKEDARTQSREVLHKRRKQVIQLRHKGMGVMTIVEQTGLSWAAVNATLKRFEQGGWTALKPNPRGRKQGSGRILSVKEEQTILTTIHGMRPEQLKMDFYLWGRLAVRQLIEDKCDIALSIRAVGNYLKRWGMNPQIPAERNYGQPLEAMHKWLGEQYPAIAAQAKLQGGEIHWGDRTTIVNTYVSANQMPVICIGEQLSMLSSVTNQGRVRWMIINTAFNSDNLIEFLEALLKDIERKQNGKRKIFLILENRPIHHSKPVKIWLSERKDRIEIFHRPITTHVVEP